MSNYVNKDLSCLHHPPSIKPQHSPHPYNDPVYGQKRQFIIPTITNKKLFPAQLKQCQELCDLSIIMIAPTTVSAITIYLKTRSWKDTRFQINQFLDHEATHPNVKIRYHSSQMHSWIHSDASYLNESKARSSNGGLFYLSDKPKLPIKPNDPQPKLNAPVPSNS